MLSTLAILFSTLALNFGAATPTPLASQVSGYGILGGTLLGFGLGGGGDAALAGLGDCLGVDIAVGASCGVLAGVGAALECDARSVEAACLAELGGGRSSETLAACTAELTAHCVAEVDAGGALFCDGHFVGAGSCLAGIDVDVKIDAEACVAGEPGEEGDLCDGSEYAGAELCLDGDLAMR